MALFEIGGVVCASGGIDVNDAAFGVEYAGRYRCRGGWRHGS